MPSNAEDICDVFDEKRGWYRHAKKAERDWNVSIPIMMAFTYKESSFKHDARPPRSRLFGHYSLAPPIKRVRIRPGDR